MDRTFILNLGKLLIGAAWVDGTLQQEEINALKELLFALPDLTGEEWMQLELYMAAPVSDEERKHLLQQVLNGMKSDADKRLALEMLQKLVHADGQVTEEEDSLWETLRRDIEGKHVGIFAHLTGPIRQALQSRVGQYRGEGTREDRLEDFIKNTIYFQVIMEMKNQGRSLSLPENEIRKVCLAAGLMARVAWVDDNICEQEEEAMRKALVEIWQLPEDEARMVVRLSHARILRGLDVVRLGKGLCDCTSMEERRAFLRCLFAVANAAHHTSHQEIEEIRLIAKLLELPHQEFIEAKLTIPREERGGL